MTACAASLLALAACAEPARELRGRSGPDGPRLLLEAFASRFGPLEREPAFDALRPKLARAALAPSRIFDDDAAWTDRARAWRGTELAAVPTGQGCRLGVRPRAGEPLRPGEYRERLRLTRVGSGRFEWEIDEELAIGRLAPDDLVSATSALLRGLERWDARAAREAIGRDLPRAAQTFGRLFRIEHLQIDREGETARLTLAVRLTPAGLEATAPRYAAYLRKYVTPMQVDVTAVDLSGARWWRLSGADDLWTLRLRVRDGSLVPLDGVGTRRLPAELRLLADYSTRMGVFGVGVRRLAADASLVRSPARLGLLVRFRQEPEWELPFLVAPLIRGTLRYPFEGPGSELAFELRQGGAQTLAAGRYRTRVRESWLLRWLGGLTSAALDDFRTAAETEAERYNRACLLALRDDLLALAGG